MHSLLRKAYFILITAVSMYGCGSASTKNELKEDSLEYYPPTPHEISKEEFRMLHRRVEAFYDSILPGKSLNGAFLVAKKGNILFEKYSGTAHLKGKDTITPNTPFHIASTSKTFTAMAILYLVQKKQLGLDDPLQKFFPSFPYEGITVKMLLSQRSALPNYMNVMDREGWDKKQRATNADVLQYFIQYKPALQGTPGRQFTYCNTNFVLLALIIEKVSGKPYGTFLHEVFFRPLKMENTFVFQWSDSARVTPSYRGNGVQEAFTWLDETCGDKNIYSTVRDLLKWDQALYSDKLFDTSLLTAAFTPYSFERPGIHNYGLGWRMYTLPSEKKIIYHNGWWHGNNSCFYRVITDSLTIIVLGNRMNRNIYRVKPLIESVTSLRFAYENGED